MEEQIVKIMQNMKVSKDRKNNYDDKKTHREFKVGKHAFLKVKSCYPHFLGITKEMMS